MSTIHNIPIIDGHNDTLLALHAPKPGKERSFFIESEHGHLDLPRAQRGQMGGGFYAIFTPSASGTDSPGAPTSGSYAMPMGAEVEQNVALGHTVAMAAQLFQIEREADGAARVVRTVQELADCLQSGVHAMIFHIEGAEAIDTELDALYVLYEAGLRSLGITWSRPNAFAFGVPFQFPHSPDTGPGLTDAGKRLVRACNELGVMLDLSHLNEKGFWDVAELSAAPLVATHSGSHALCAVTPQTVTDAQLDAVAASGGIAGVNFNCSFLREDGRLEADTPLEDIARHVDYMVERMGVDHVAFGSDFDGALMPLELKDVTGLPKLMELLRGHGYGEGELRKLAFENWLRVLGQSWK
ncbi:MAG: membrane dipeptidase [Caldilineaceae bacterium]|nr:membrane dipeptidase [Caldilineaceae bacterium]